MRSVHIGCSRYSWRYHLLVALSFRGCDGAGARPRAQSPELGVCLWYIPAFLNYAAASLRFRVGVNRAGRGAETSFLRAGQPSSAGAV